MSTQRKRRTHGSRPSPTVPAALSHDGVYDRQPEKVGTTLEYFLTDFIRLKDWTTLPKFMSYGKELRSWFERHTTWQLVLSGYCAGDNVCQDDHGRQILNLWRITTNNLDSIPKGLNRLGTDTSSKGKLLGAAFSRLLDLFYVEHHFITRADGAYAAPPAVRSALRLPGYVPIFVYVEFWVPYGGDLLFNSDLVGPSKGTSLNRSNLSLFPAPWQFVANVRAISGRVNTYSQYWLRMVPADADRDTLNQELRREIKRAAWYRKFYRPQRVDLLTPTDYDPTQYPRSKEG